MSDDNAQNRTADDEPRALRAKQELALSALLRGDSITDAAEAAGVRRECVSRWANGDRVFRAELEAAQRGQRDDLERRQVALRARLAAAGEDAIAVLHDLAKNARSERTRVQAAVGLLRHLLPPPSSKEGAETGSRPPLTAVGFYSGEAERQRIRELTEFSPAERDLMRDFWEGLVGDVKRLAAGTDGGNGGGAATTLVDEP